LAIGVIAAPWLAKRFAGMSPSEIIAASIEMASHSLGKLMALLGRLFKQWTTKKPIPLPDK
jgi:hypothetical protein